MLPPAALATLKGIERDGSNPCVFAGWTEDKPLQNVGHVWERVRALAGLEDVRLHDLRHSFASVAVAGGASLPLIGGILGHSSQATTARYAHLSDDPLRALATTTASSIESALAGKPAKSKPLRFSKRRRG